MNKQTPSLSEAAKLLSLKELVLIRKYFNDALFFLARLSNILGTQETELTYQGFILPLREHITLIDDNLNEKRRLQND